MRKKWLSGWLALLLLAVTVGGGLGQDSVVYAEPEVGQETGTAEIVVYENSINKTPADMIAWATGFRDYKPNESTTNVNTGFRTPERAVGPHNGQLVVLGDLGEITMEFKDGGIGNGPGEDFAVFENGFANPQQPGWGFLELAYVEVSTDGQHWVRFDSESLTENPVGGFAYTNQSNLKGLAGKALSGYGTGFDLEALKDKPEVASGLVKLNRINYIKIVDIMGDGAQKDSYGNPIYDPHPTTGSAGFDLTGIGVLNKAFTVTYSATVEVVSPDLAHEGLPFVAMLEVEEGTTAFEALQTAVGEDELVYSVHPEFGAFIQSIFGLAGNSTDWWSFIINDEFAEVGASSYLVQDGDQLQWSYYVAPEPEPPVTPEPPVVTPDPPVTNPPYIWPVIPSQPSPTDEEQAEEAEGSEQEGPIETPEEEAPVSPQPPAVEAPRFTDQTQASAWAQEAILRAAELGIFAGKPAGDGVAFDPKGTATRAEFTKILVSLAYYESAAEPVADFSDVSVTAWYAGYVARAKQENLINGFADGSFQPGAAITRQDAAVIIARAFGLTVSENAPIFADVRAAYATAAVRAVAEAGIMQGYDGSFRPQDQITREELAVVAVRVYDVFVGLK